MTAPHIILVFVHVQVSVQYRVLVERSYDAFYRLSDPGVQIRSYAFDVIRSTVPRMTVDEAFVSKSTIADTIMERLFERMKDYGYEIIGALITDLTPDEKVKASMNEIEASKRLKEAIPHRAEAGKFVRLSLNDSRMLFCSLKLQFKPQKRFRLSRERKHLLRPCIYLEWARQRSARLWPRV